MAKGLLTTVALLPEPGKRNILITSALPYVNNVPHLGNKYHTIHAEIYKWFNISFDLFGRTTIQLQTDITQDIFLKLNDNGFLKERMTTQLYCQQHHSFLADRFVEGECPTCGHVDARGDQCDLCGQFLEPLELRNPRCKIDGSTPVTKDTKHIFLELDKLQPELKEGLQPRSITRDMKWGTEVPLPGYEDKVTYPWFDACIGYFLGKDNVVYHSVIFPASQIGTEDVWTKVHHLSVTDYLTYEGGKFSKSRGMGVFGDSAQQTGVSSGVWPCLLNNLGNFVSRVLKFVNLRFYNNIELDAVKLRAGLATVLRVSQQGNLFLQANELDGKLYENEPSKCAAVIGLSINLIYLLASVIAPYMSETAQSIHTQLRVDPLSIPDHWNADSIKPSHGIGKAEHLFSRIQPEKAQVWREMFGSQEEVQEMKEEETAIKAKKSAGSKAAKPSKPKSDE
ncbi:hypothetical protein AJ80_09732 [Polytolypa hystricis UAMH7299]|uniref:Methionyl-tRNA synthetase n=1 Tax=Polytolypa hystricis (strain UAMH7299) TaxID=1447883 RepID=A0A2B7WKR7_POLH7|nr:hypothetical protein AJ80_09732 [Polytolypa hystricis UAMH7299]